MPTAFPTISSLIGNSQRLDGGAMFGNVPRALWEKWAPPDERNRISLACRALLVQEEERNILFEAGIGNFFPPKLRDRYGVQESEPILLNSLEAHGLTHNDIDIVVLSHLHFDHAGGLLSGWEEGVEPTLLFPNASFVIGKEAWERACQPHYRDRASFIPELNELLSQSNRLEIVDGATSSRLGENYRFHYSHGHTPGLMLTEISSSEGPIVFAGDLIPGAPWVHLPITMGYDRYPELLIDEKQALLADIESRGGRLFFTHDPEIAMGKVTLDDRKRFGITDAWGEFSERRLS